MALISLSFPTRRSSDLRRQQLLSVDCDDAIVRQHLAVCVVRLVRRADVERVRARLAVARIEREREEDGRDVVRRDRKSTRLNSSHLVISYAVYCLKKKK